jgi:probable rRNA maturation factor
MIKHRIYIARRHRGSLFKMTLLIRRCIRATLDKEGVNVPCEVNVTITDNREIQEVNLETRHIDSATDVLSFPAFELKAGAFSADETQCDPETGRMFLGDIMLSTEKVLEQAAEYGHSPEREAGYLTIHSTLHLLGYDHTDEGPEKARMREAEERILQEIGLNKND